MPNKINSLSSGLIFLDEVSDYIPVVSTFTNLVDIFAKCVLKTVSSFSETAPENLKKNHYFKYLDDKSLFHCIGLLIPGFNIYVKIYYMDESKNEKIIQELKRWKETQPNSLFADMAITRINKFLSSSQCYKRLLDLDGCGLTSLPDIFHSPSFKLLIKLNLSHNQFTAFPPQIGNLSALTNLNLYRNKLTALPPEIGNLSALTNLNLDGNKLTALPAEIGNLAALTNLDLCFNKLTALPAEIGNLTRLKHLSLSRNKLTALPREIGNLTRLKHLNLYNNQIAALPCEIRNLTRLKHLNLSENELTALPAEIGNLSALTNLDLFGNKLTALPAEIGNLSALTNLKLSENELTALPAEIGNLTGLTCLTLSDNQQLTGLPEEILQLSNDCTIELSGCSSLSEAVLGRLCTHVVREGYTGPRISISMAHANPFNPDEAMSINELLENLYKITDRPYAELTHISTNDQEKRNLQKWLARLSFMADYNASPDRKKWLSNIILDHLELAEKDPEFCKTFNAVIHDASGTCGDRLALSVIHLGIARKLATINLSNMVELAEFLKRGVFAMALLEECAREKTETLRFFDEIEVFLAYPVMLKNQLNLPIDVEEMLYLQCSGVKPQDLDEAFRIVNSKLNDEVAVQDFLVENNKWNEALQFNFPEKYAEIEAERENSAEEDEADLVLIDMEYKKNLKNLTSKALSA